MSKDDIKDWTLYLLQCPVTTEFRYVGITSQTLTKRLREHIRDTSGMTCRSDTKVKWIAWLEEKNLKPLIVGVFCIRGTRGQAEKVEREYVYDCVRKGYRLLNVNFVGGIDGGYFISHANFGEPNKDLYKGTSLNEILCIAEIVSEKRSIRPGAGLYLIQHAMTQEEYMSRFISDYYSKRVCNQRVDASTSDCDILQVAAI